MYTIKFLKENDFVTFYKTLNIKNFNELFVISFLQIINNYFYILKELFNYFIKFLLNKKIFNF